MRIAILIGFIVLFTGNVFSQKTTKFTPVINSNWSNPLNWSNGKPTASDTAIIQVFILDNCRVDEDAQVHDLYNEDGGSLIIEKGSTLVVSGNLYLGGNSTIENYGNIDVKGSIFKDGVSRLQVFSSINVQGSIEF